MASFLLTKATMKIKFAVTLIILLVAIGISFVLFKPQLISYGINAKVGPNGIWLDVQPFIDAHSKTKKQRLALEQLIRVMQKQIENPYLCRDYIDHQPDEGARALECYWKVFGYDAKGVEIYDIENAVVDSISRAKAFAKFNGYCRGGLFSLWDEKKYGPACSFETN